jgi:hypothetical protein
MDGLNKKFMSKPLDFLKQHQFDIWGDSKLQGDGCSPIIKTGVYEFDILKGGLRRGEVRLRLYDERGDAFESPRCSR